MEEKKTKNNILGIGCLTLFFGPFVVVGLFTLYLSVHGIYKSQVSKKWTKTIASVDTIDFESSSSKGTTSLETAIKYHYSVDNKTFKGNTIGFGYGMNNIDFHSEIFEKLKYAKKIYVYVNPSDAAESVITTGLNNSLVGISIFTLMWNFFIGIFIGPIFIKNQGKRMRI
jgi:Protein of unknown function (DUF3592)